MSAAHSQVPSGKSPCITDLQVIILAGGKAERLRPLSVGFPKALFSVCNCPLIGVLLNQIRDAGISQVELVLSYSTEEILRLIDRDTPGGLNVKVTVPPAHWNGSFGTVSKLHNKESSAVLVIYGDSLLQADLAMLLRAHLRTRHLGGLATILYHNPPDLFQAEESGRTYHGVMSLDSARRVIRFEEKPLVSNIVPGFNASNAAVFVCEKALIEHPMFQEAMDFSYDVFEPCVRSAVAPVFGCDIGNGFRFDIGSCRRFFEINIKALHGHYKLPIGGTMIEPRIWSGNDVDLHDVELIPPVVIGNGAEVAAGSVVGPNVVLGHKCVVGKAARICNAILLDNCTVEESCSLDHCMLGTGSSVMSGCSLPAFTVIGSYGVFGGRDWPC